MYDCIIVDNQLYEVKTLCSIAYKVLKNYHCYNGYFLASKFSIGLFGIGWFSTLNPSTVILACFSSTWCFFILSKLSSQPLSCSSWVSLPVFGIFWNSSLLLSPECIQNLMRVAASEAPSKFIKHFLNRKLLAHKTMLLKWWQDSLNWIYSIKFF